MNFNHGDGEPQRNRYKVRKFSPIKIYKVLVVFHIFLRLDVKLIEATCLIWWHST